MRLSKRFAAVLGIHAAFACLPRADAAPSSYVEAVQDFSQRFASPQRTLAQILLIAAGYTNAVPYERYTTRLYQAIRDFENDNGFAPDGRLEKAEVDRLVAAASVYLDLWAFRSVAYPDRALAIWTPTGLGLVRSQTESGLHFKDPQGRLTVHLLSLRDKSAANLYRGILVEARGEQTKINYSTFKDSENWFVISSTAKDGRDRYYRYHQDGADVTGFALEWNNAAGNVHAERIAVIMSGSLRAAMLGLPFVDPPQPEAQVQAPPPITPATVPVAPAPPPSPKSSVSSGSGFFVSDDGDFVTNAHVVQDCDKISVTIDDKSVNEAKRVAIDSSNDLALLRIAATPGRVVALRVGGGLRVGEGVEAFGFPHADLLASAGNFTLGNISALSGLRDDSRYLQISTPVQAGNSGGPLLDTSGNLVGVVSAKLNAMKVMQVSDDLPQNVNFAIKASTLANFLDANRVTYKTGTPAAVPLPPADIADQAHAVSGFVVCK